MVQPVGRLLLEFQQILSIGLEVINDACAVRIDPNLIPSVEKTLLCATFLEAVILFYQDPGNLRAFEEWRAKKGEDAYGSKNS